jgi:hypothetical protein
MRLTAAVLALSATACLRPPNKQTGYIVNGAVAGVGTAMLIHARSLDCSGMDIGPSIGCGLNQDGGQVMGIGLIALGALGVILTAASDAPDTP